jgi:hypothetical protein
MTANEDKSPYGRGFIAACIVIAAVLLCAALLLITGPTSSNANGPGTTSRSAAPDAQAAGGAASPGDPAAPASGDPGSCAAADSAADHPASGDSASDKSASCGPATGDVKGGSGCGLAAGGEEIPAEAPAVDGWEVSRRVVVPRSSAYGPGKQDRDGFRRCFAHSPTGAVYAAYNVIAAMADQHKVLTTAGKLMLPGPATDTLLADLRKETADEDSNPTQIAGFRVLDASADRATVMLAMPVETAFMSANFTLVWHDGDWRLVPPGPGDSLGAPYAQQRDLSGFVAWSGV